MTDTDPVRWGVLGMADIALHAVMPAIQAVPGAQLHAVATRRATGAPTFDAGLAPRQVYAAADAYDQLLADPSVEAVYIPVPNHLHRHWAIRAARAGKHVLCEKPLGVSPQEVAEMRDVADDCGVLLMEAFMYRYNPQHRRVRELISAGSLGTVRLFQASFTVALDAPDDNIRMKSEPGAGALFDVGVYAINAARWMFDSMPTAAHATAVRYGDGDADEITGITLTFPGDRLAVIDCALTLAYRNYYDVIGGLGSVHVERPFASPPFQPAQERLGTRITSRAGDSTRTEWIPDVDQYQLEIEAFDRAVRGDTSALYSTQQSAADAAVLAACVASIRSGKSEAVDAPAAYPREQKA
jgi:D-xylose 1-dehydrogenase (NADP+, D-xylono-1,5-lactone-forming)